MVAPITFRQAQPLAMRAQPGDRAELYCLVMGRKRGSSVIFWDVTDGTSTETVQVGIRKPDFEEAAWSRLRSIARGARLQISGLVGVSESGIKTIWLDAYPSVQTNAFPETLSAVEPHRQRIGASIFVAHFRSIAEPSLVGMGYLPVDVRLLTHYWHGGDSPYTIRALYSGFGEPMFLAPSPSPQLLEALIATGRNRVFTSTSIFTSSYRGRPDGSEASVVMAKTLDCALGELIDDARNLLAAIFNAIGASEEFDDPTEWIVLPTEWPHRFAIDEIESPHIQSFRQVDSTSKRITELARFVLPPNFVPLEVVTETSHDGVTMGTVVLHLERLLPLVQHLPIRRLQSIEPLFPSKTNEEDNR